MKATPIPPNTQYGRTFKHIKECIENPRHRTSQIMTEQCRCNYDLQRKSTNIKDVEHQSEKQQYAHTRKHDRQSNNMTPATNTIKNMTNLTEQHRLSTQQTKKERKRKSKTWEDIEDKNKNDRTLQNINENQDKGKHMNPNQRT